MKIEPRRVPAFLRDPGPFACVLLHGDDLGLIVERAALLARTVLDDPDDPFRAATLDRDAHARLAEEASARALTGGRRVVRVRDVTDALLPQVKAALEGAPEALLLLEAPDLTSRSKLRAFAEGHPLAAVIGCYPDDGRTLEAAIRERLTEARVPIDDEAMRFLLQHLGADRAMTRAEVEKLILYAGSGGRIDLEAAQGISGDTAALSAEDAVHAAAAGDVATCDRALGVAFSEGAAPVGLLRMMQTHLQRLHRARLAVEGGMGPEEAVRAMRPPPFFKKVPGLVRAVSRWRAAGLLRAMEAARAAERDCKRTGAPDRALCRAFFMGLAV